MNRTGCLTYIFIVALAALVCGGLMGFFPVNLATLNPDQMILAGIIFFVSVGIGLAAKLLLDWLNTEAEITWTEFAVGSVVIGIVFSVLGVNAAWNMAWNNTVTFREYWNGWELQAVEVPIPCERDGSCVHEYDCDSYTVRESYSCGEDGEDTCYRNVTKYHSCPYATTEYNHVVKTTLGDYVIDSNVFAQEPVEWRVGGGIPGNVQRGPAQFWLDAKARCEAGQPGPVTKRSDYKNYILASDETILKQYSSMIDQYVKAGVMPALQYGVRDYYNADKVYFVGFKPADLSVWLKAHAYLNAAFGTELQGDLHLVLIQNTLVSANPDAYLLALKAYWQNPDVAGKDALSKNAVIVVVGTTDGTTVAWARAITGMPIGNEAMVLAVRNKLKGLPITPEAVVGTVGGEFYVKTADDGTQKTKVRGVGEVGALRRIFWGMDEKADKFVRISMSGDSAGDVGGGFKYLASEIKPSVGAQVTIVIVSILLSCVVWFIVAFLIGERERRSYRRNY